MLTRTNDVVVLDIGGTHIRVGHIRDGNPASEFECISSETLRVPSPKESLLKIISTYTLQHNLKLNAVVLGIPGMLDRKNDAITHCNNIPQLEGHGLKHSLSISLDCPVLLEQDTMLQLLGECHSGVGKNQNSVFGVYFGTGIGAAYLLNGNPDNPLVQDIQAGHIPIMAQGRLCKCGNTDCVEAYASGHTLTGLAKQANCPVEEIFKYSKPVPQQTTIANELQQFIRYQAYMLATVITLFRPNVLVIGGGIPLMADYPRHLLIEITTEQLQKPYPAETIKFTWASLGITAPLYGALALLQIHNENLS